MTGQDAVRSAEAFAEIVPLTGHILTKLDGDARGGAALSITSATGKPIKFVGIGEKLDAFEPFHPDRMASRILGMGDVLTLIERAEQAVEQEEAEELARKLRRDDLTLEDFRQQLKQIRRMGSLGELLSFLPGTGQLPTELDESEMTRFEAILNSMTVHERQFPTVINGSRRRRIAMGSGTLVSDVNRLLRRFNEARKMMKTLARAKGKGGNKLKKMMSQFR
jgi:signal recognition particle subunit SRP54